MSPTQLYLHRNSYSQLHLFSIIAWSSILSLSRHDQLSLMRLSFVRCFYHYRKEISQNVASLNLLIHDVINLLYYKQWTDKPKYFLWITLIPGKKIVLENYRNSRPEVSEKGTLKNLATAGLWLRPEACKFIKKRLQQRCFPVSFTKFLRTPFL